MHTRNGVDTWSTVCVELLENQLSCVCGRCRNWRYKLTCLHRVHIHQSHLTCTSCRVALSLFWVLVWILEGFIRSWKVLNTDTNQHEHLSTSSKIIIRLPGCYSLLLFLTRVYKCVYVLKYVSVKCSTYLEQLTLLFLFLCLRCTYCMNVLFFSDLPGDNRCIQLY